jgi:hypothetical protein
MCGGTHIRVVIARHEGDVARRSERGEPSARRRVFAGKRDVDEVAGHRDVVRRPRFEVGRDAREHLGAMDAMALAPPVEKAGCTFAGELGQPRRRQRPEMGIRQMREHEHGFLVSRTSAASALARAERDPGPSARIAKCV